MSGPDVHVTGGVGGTDAHLEDLATLARGSDDLAMTLATISAECHTMLADPDVLASAVLDPGGAAAFEKALLTALDGRHGLTALSVGFGQRAVALRTVAASYQATDAAQQQLMDGLRWSVGRLAPLIAPVAAPTVLLAGGLAFGEFATVDPIGTSLTLTQWQRLLTDHPGVVDNAVGAGPGLLSWIPGGGITDVRGASHLVGMLYPDGRATVADQGVDTHLRMVRPPTGFGDLMDGLDYRNGKAHAGDDEIDVRVVTHPDGTKAYIVDIPGTKDWNAPLSLNPNLNDLGTNVHVLGGDVTAREHAIADALHRAGANSSDPVMLVGHSQGGMVAAQAAHDTATGAFNYNVTHIMTAGSPIARADVPPNVQVLALENSHDIVPHLDARDNPDQPNVTTATFSTQNGTIGDNHATDKSYLPAAKSLDSTTNPSVKAYHDSAGAFLSTKDDGTKVQSHVYRLTRQP